MRCCGTNGRALREIPRPRADSSAVFYRRACCVLLTLFHAFLSHCYPECGLTSCLDIRDEPQHQFPLPPQRQRRLPPVRGGARPQRHEVARIPRNHQPHAIVIAFVRAKSNDCCVRKAYASSCRSHGEARVLPCVSETVLRPSRKRTSICRRVYMLVSPLLPVM